MLKVGLQTISSKLARMQRIFAKPSVYKPRVKENRRFVVRVRLAPQAWKLRWCVWCHWRQWLPFTHWSIYRHRSLTCRTTCGSSWWHVMRSTVRVLEVVLDTIVCVTVTVVSFRSHYPWPMAKLSMNFSVAWVFKWHVLAATWLTKYKEARDSKYSAPRSVSDYRWATAMHKL